MSIGKRNIKSNNNKNWRCWLHHNKHRIPIQMNFKQITRVKVKFIQYSDIYIYFVQDVTLLSFCRSFNDATLLCFLSHSNDMTSWLNSSAENVSCNIAAFLYNHSVVITTSCIRHLVSDRRLSLISKENVHNVI